MIQAFALLTILGAVLGAMGFIVTHDKQQWREEFRWMHEPNWESRLIPENPFRD